MPKFSYRAIDNKGKTVEGVVEAGAEAGAAEILVGRGLIPSQMREEARSAGGGFNLSELLLKMQSVPAREIILFTKQLSTMLRAGVPMMRSLEILDEQSENQKLKLVAGAIAQDIRHGSNLSDALRKHPKEFPPLYSSMIGAGEASGALPQTMDRLIYVMEHDQKVKNEVSSALQYPMLVVVSLTIAFFVLLTGVVPRFARIFERAKLDLPMPTKICMGLSDFIINYWYVVLAAAAALALGGYFYFRTDRGRYVKDSIVLHTPIIGPLMVKAALSRFASIFAVLQSTGVAILSAMDILAGTIGNAVIERELQGVSEKLEEGHGLAEPLKSSKYFTPMLINMVAIGEESGSLDEMLREVSVHYDAEVEYAMKKLTDSIGPILLVALAAVVGFFALAIFMPMWDLTKMAQR